MTVPTESPDFSAAHARVRELCDHFDARRDEIMAPGYKEDAARHEFITPFFEALGWDVRNTAHRSVYEKDVVTEKREDIAGIIRSADYAFRRPGSHLTSFFVEAKKPSVDIRTHGPCYQAVLYGWNATTPLVVLTDFGQLLILDARSRPDKNNAVRHILREHGSYTYADYRDPEKFSEIWGLLARSNVAAGSLDKAAAALPKLSGRIKKDDFSARGTRPVDEEFLAQMELWRDKLAKSLKRSNHHLDGDRLTALTQRILDRLVFLRFLEDRGIERDVTYADFGKSGSVWRDFLKVSRRLDARYNGIIYKKDPHGCEDPELIIDDPAFAAVVENLVPQNSDYLFGSISVTILGSIYERFLGNVIVARDKTAVVEPKPEVRKAGGVFYTPDYIVRYIVEQTVGKCIAGKTPPEIQKLRFADIACGSGSFLVEVFACLIRYHLAWYVADEAVKWEKKDILRKREIDGDYVLTLAEKRRILLACVFGVDLDPSAVEVSQLSLYLKLMEDESFPSTQALFDFEKHALLPDLQGHIICGNSLIEGDVRDLFGLTDEEEERIRPLDFRTQFHNVFRGKDSGFSAIVGNPPYIRAQHLRDIIPLTPDYCREHYTAAQQGNYDLYVVFVERALQLLNAEGSIGYIIPHKFFNARYGKALRRLLTAGEHVRDIVHFGHQQVFKGPTTYTCLLFLSMARQSEMGYAPVENLAEWEAQPAPFVRIPQLPHGEGDWTLASVNEKILITRLAEQSDPLEIVTERIFQGLKTSADKIYIVEERERKGRRVRVFSQEKQAEYWLEAALLHPLIKGGNSRRYRLSTTKRLILFPYEKAAQGSVGLIPAEKLAARYPLTWAYLLENRRYLEQREDGKMKGPKWFGYVYPKALDVMTLPKLFTPDIAPLPSFSEDTTGELFFTGGVSGGYGLLVKQEWNRHYVLALLNSRLLGWVLAKTSTRMRGGWHSFESRFIHSLPIHRIASNDAERAIHDNLVKNVHEITSAKESAAAAVDGVKAGFWIRKVKVLDRQIDNLVYKLYGLTEEEIELVEGEAPVEADLPVTTFEE